MGELHSKTWEKAGELLRKSRLSTLMPAAKDEACWDEAYDLTILSITEEREYNPDFAKEINQLDEQTDYKYNLLECLEAYFDHLEAMEKWEEVIYSCNRIIDLFAWKEVKPSEFLFRKGNAYEALKRFDAAEAFGKKWLESDPTDLFAAASNVYLKATLGKYDEADEIVEKYLGEELQCEDSTDTFFMAAYRLYEMTDNMNAKRRVEKKMADYNRIIAERKRQF